MESSVPLIETGGAGSGSGASEQRTRAPRDSVLTFHTSTSDVSLSREDLHLLLLGLQTALLLLWFFAEVRD